MIRITSLLFYETGRENMRWLQLNQKNWAKSGKHWKNS